MFKCGRNSKNIFLLVKDAEVNYCNHDKLDHLFNRISPSIIFSFRKILCVCLCVSEGVTSVLRYTVYSKPGFNYWLYIVLLPGATLEGVSVAECSPGHPQHLHSGSVILNTAGSLALVPGCLAKLCLLPVNPLDFWALLGRSPSLIFFSLAPVFIYLFF